MAPILRDRLRYVPIGDVCVQIASKSWRVVTIRLAVTLTSPPKSIGTETNAMTGAPDPLHIPTFYVERQNLTMRMSMRRFIRLTDSFLEEVENFAAAVPLHSTNCNVARPHIALMGQTPAMSARIADH